MQAKHIDKISDEVYRKHPDLKGVKPKVMPREGDPADDTLLIYEKQVAGPGGKTIRRIVRAVADQSGKIKKISTSKG